MMIKRAFMGIAGAALAIGLSATGAFAQEVTLHAPVSAAASQCTQIDFGRLG